MVLRIKIYEIGQCASVDYNNIIYDNYFPLIRIINIFLVLRKFNIVKYYKFLTILNRFCLK